MKMELYDAVYIISNIFFAYTIYKFQRVFFDERQSSALTEFLSYATYFAISTVVYLFCYIPIALMASNLFMLLMLTFNYRATIKKRFLAVALIYLTLLCVEMLMVLLAGYIDLRLLQESQYSLVLGILLIRIFTFITVLLMSGFRNLRRGVNIPTEYWVNVLLVPVSSIVIMILLFNSAKIETVSLLICISLLFLVNFGTFYLYDRIIWVTDNKTQMLLASQQNEYYKKQIALMKSSMEGMRVLRHDLRNQLSAIQAIAQSGDLNAVNQHIDSLIGANVLTKNYADSGNVNIDSILNYKMFEAEQSKIPVSLQYNIPPNLNVSSVDVCSILGNLIDNAMNACEKLPADKRKINLSVRFDKKCLVIAVANPYAGDLIYEDGKLQTSNKDKENHGIGLLSIRKVVEKYDGIMDIENTEEIFKITIILPI